MFKGVATALITPFNSTGVDYKAFAKLIEFQIQAGIDALVVLGTTGEPATMTSEEKTEVIRFAVKTINHRVPVIVGTGSNNTICAVSDSIEAAKLGADMLLVVTPYYNKCTQSGLIQHFASIAESVTIPIIAYNVPSRTGVNILPATVRAIAGIPNIIGIKEASGNIGQMVEIQDIARNMDFELYSGDDGIIVPVMSLGAAGLISVASNIIPSVMVDIVHSCMDGDYSHAIELFFKYHDLLNTLFVEVNPIPVKFAASKLGYGENILRLPLTPLSESGAARLIDVMRDVNLI